MTAKNTQKPAIIKLRPGTAAEKSMKFQLPKEQAKGSIDQVVNYALGLTEADGLTREYLRIAERVKVEMKEKYGISVNGMALEDSKKANIVDYLQDKKTEKGLEYLEAEIIVAARQEGAKSLIYRI